MLRRRLPDRALPGQSGRPRVRAGARRGASPARGVDSVLAESLHHHPLEHGAHHERYFVQLGPVARLLLGLCFCEHCLAGARRHGADPVELRRRACAEVERAFAGDAAQSSAELSYEDAARAARRPARRAAGVALRGRRDARGRARGGDRRAGRAARAARRLRRGQGLRDRSPRGRPGALDRLAPRRRHRRLRASGRRDRRDRLRRRSRPAWRSTSRPTARWRPAPRWSRALRPVLPDSDSSENLAAKLRAASEAGVDRVDFYHYGLAPLSALDRVREALALASAGTFKDCRSSAGRQPEPSGTRPARP